VAAFAAEGSARSVAIGTLDGAVIAEANGAIVRPAASLLKVPLAMAAYDAAERGELDLDARVSRRVLGSTPYSSVLAVLDEDHRFTIRELCGVFLSTSDNPAAEYVLGLVGRAAVNAVLTALGCEGSELRVGFAVDDIGAAGRVNVTTAFDMLRVFQDVAANASRSEMRGALENNLRNSRLPLRLADEARVAHKTGSLEGVVNDVGILPAAHGEIIVAILCDAEPDEPRASVAIGDLASALCG
jgi:beta-lactamase class A